jgi:DNA polymerase
MENYINEIEKFLKYYQTVYSSRIYLDGVLLKPDVNAVKEIKKDTESEPQILFQETPEPKPAPAIKKSPPRRKASAAARLPVFEGELQKFYEEIRNCKKCSLSESRTNLVFGGGNSHADILFIGEAPGKDEDEQGIPFVGKAGQLLNKMLQAIELDRNEIFIANILKCRPPQNRDPLPEEVSRCEPHLKRQIELIAPKIIVALGRIAGQTLLKMKDETLRDLRSRLHQYNGVPLIVTYHPAALLRNPNWKRESWQDLKKIKKFIS